MDCRGRGDTPPALADEYRWAMRPRHAESALWCGSSQVVRIERASTFRAILGEGFVREGGKGVSRFLEQLRPVTLGGEFGQHPAGESLLFLRWELRGFREGGFQRSSHQ